MQLVGCLLGMAEIKMACLFWPNLATITNVIQNTPYLAFLSHLMILPVVSIHIVFPAEILFTILAVIPVLIMRINMPIQMFLGKERFLTKLTRIGFSVCMHLHVFF